MADLITLTLLYHPGMGEREEKMEQLYQNVLNFIDDITSTIFRPVDQEGKSVNHYDPIFSCLKNSAKLMSDLATLLSQDHIKMQLQTMEHYYNMNKSILECINVFSHLIHSNIVDIRNFDVHRLTSIEISAHHNYRSLLKDLTSENEDWHQTFVLYLVGDKMSAIVFQCCEACKKILACRLSIADQLEG